MSTDIEWADDVWNPVVGCSRVSDACKFCYAMAVAHVRAGNPKTPMYAGTTHKTSHGVDWSGKINFVESALTKPLRRKKPTRYFVNSMSDLFHSGVTDEMIDKIFAVMALCPQHTFIVLTKRPERMRRYLTSYGGNIDGTFPEGVSLEMEALGWESPETISTYALPGSALPDDPVWPIPNVWLGVSVEDQATADERIPLLLATPAAVRVVSAEPLLGPIDFDCIETMYPSGVPGMYKIGWIIVGGESGHGARPMHPDWVRSIRDQCYGFGVPFFFKQWGAWCTEAHWETMRVSDLGDRYQPGWSPKEALKMKHHDFDDFKRMYYVGKKRAGRLLDGRTHDEMPKVNQ